MEEIKTISTDIYIYAIEDVVELWYFLPIVYVNKFFWV